MAIEGLGPVRRLLTMARAGARGDAVTGWSAAAIVFQIVGWACQLLAVYTAMRAFDIHAPLPAAGVVLLVMNVVTILPFWPGNVGLVQVAIASALVGYGVVVQRGGRLRIRAAGDRGVGRDRRRAALPRPRRALVRDAARDAHGRPGRGAARGVGRGRGSAGGARGRELDRSRLLPRGGLAPRPCPARCRAAPAEGVELLAALPQRQRLVERRLPCSSRCTICSSSACACSNVGSAARSRRHVLDACAERLRRRADVDARAG